MSLVGYSLAPGAELRMGIISLAGLSRPLTPMGERKHHDFRLFERT
jgi:hypothetical protein